MMMLENIIDHLNLILDVIPDYEEGRRRGFTDDLTEKLALESIYKAINLIEHLYSENEELKLQNEVLLEKINVSSPLMTKNQ